MWQRLYGRHIQAMKTEQEYFLFKNYYLLFISSTRDERKKFKNVYKKSKRDLQSKLVLVLNNPYLINKEKIVLFLSSISISFARLLFILKNPKFNHHPFLIILHSTLLPAYMETLHSLNCMPYNCV